MKPRLLWIGLTSGIVILLIAGAIVINRLSDDAPPVPQGDVQRGHDLIVQYGCGSCHTISGVAGANGQVGPILNQLDKQMYIAGILPNSWQNLVAWIQNPQAIKPHDIMPDLGVSEAEARDIAAFLYRQPSILDFLSR